MRSNVHFEGAQRRVNLIAVLAAEALLCLVALDGWTVELQVLGEARVGGIGF